MTEVRRGLLAAAALGAAMTVGDWIWARWLTDGDMVAGLVHGVAFFAALAGVLGWAARASLVRLMLTLPIAGLAIAAGFYGLFALTRDYRVSLLACWAAMWLATAAALRQALGADEPPGRTALRGLLATVGAGLSFWSIAWVWTSAGAGTGYAARWALWTWAFAPGLLALLVRRPLSEGAPPPSLT